MREILISKKRWNALVNRVAALEKAQDRPHESKVNPLKMMKAALEETLCQAPQQPENDIKVQ